MKDGVRICSNTELHCRGEIIKIILYFKNNLNLKIGHGKDIRNPEYYCFVERLKKDEFKFCFHSLT